MNWGQFSKIMIKDAPCMRALCWKMLVDEKRGRFSDRKPKVHVSWYNSKRRNSSLFTPTPICPQCLKPIFFFSPRITFKVYLFSLLFGSFFPSFSFGACSFTVSSSPMVQIKHSCGRVKRAAPICTSEWFGFAELKTKMSLSAFQPISPPLQDCPP